MSSAEQKFYERRFPSKVVVPQMVMQGVVTTGAAQAVSIMGGIAAANRPTGRCWVDVEALTEACRVHTHNTTNAADAPVIAATNGVLIPAGTRERFWIHPSVETAFHILSTGAGRFNWYVQCLGGEGSGQYGTPGV